jgi:phosphonate transport system substrate-binding protein
MKPVTVGAVLYDPKVATIWEIISNFFEQNGVPTDTKFYATYELQTEALARGEIDIAWNSPLAWLDSVRRTPCRAIAMRDADRDRVTHVIVRSESNVERVEDLGGKIVATGAKDSPQATLIPLSFIERHGLKRGEEFEVRRFDVLVGKHGDHIGGELDALKSLMNGEADAACVLDLNWELWTTDGTADPNRLKVLATTDRFDHCVFTVREEFDPEVEKRWLAVLFSMDYGNPDHRNMMDLEGLKEWLPGRTCGFGPLAEAVERLRYFEEQAHG